MKKPTFRDIDKNSEYPDPHMPMDEFLDNVRVGAYTDDDGHGEYATATQVSDISVPITEICRSTFQPPDWATHVVWYGK